MIDTNYGLNASDIDIVADNDSMVVRKKAFCRSRAPLTPKSYRVVAHAHLFEIGYERLIGV
jgi:hypothetical protein